MRLLLFMTLLTACGGDKIHPIDSPEDTAGTADPLPDTDGDGVADTNDACPEDPLQWTDADGDGQCDEIDDACPDDPLQYTDVDGDGHCDEVADDCPDDPNQWVDSDEDGICDDDDCAPLDPNNTDTDGDGICDAQDACPEIPGGDTDGDGHCDDVDDCPEAMGHVDSNGDGLCDENDDNDGDGLSNADEGVYGSDCRISSPELADTDGDGILDPDDPFPRDPWPEFVLFGNDAGTIDFMLSNRDGTFQPTIQIGDLYGNTNHADYRYRFFCNLRFLTTMGKWILLPQRMLIRATQPMTWNTGGFGEKRQMSCSNAAWELGQRWC